MQALTLMVERGLKISDAAEEAGMQYESLRLALKRPHVREALADAKRAWLESETFVAWNTVASLQRNAASEDVKLKAARVFIGAAGELEPNQGRGSVAGGVFVQIITPAPSAPLPVSDRGVFESPAFHFDQLPRRANCVDEHAED